MKDFVYEIAVVNESCILGDDVKFEIFIHFA